MSTLRRDRIPDLLETVHQVEEPADSVIHGIILGTSVNLAAPTTRDPAAGAIAAVWQVRMTLTRAPMVMD
jgi:hypothetical protein